MPLDLALIGICWLRIIVVFMAFIALSTARDIRDAADQADWSIASRRMITVIGWAIALGPVGAFIGPSPWLGVAAVWIVLAWAWFGSTTIIGAIERRAGIADGSSARSASPLSTDLRLMAWHVDGWAALIAGVGIGASAFFGRTPAVVPAFVVAAWLAARRPIPIAWISVAGFAVGVVGGAIATAAEPLTAAVVAVAAILAASALRRAARGEDRPPAAASG